MRPRLKREGCALTFRGVTATVFGVGRVCVDDDDDVAEGKRFVPQMASLVDDRRSLCKEWNGMEYHLAKKMPGKRATPAAGPPHHVSAGHIWP